LRPTDIVIDADPRNYAGEDSLKALRADFALPECPTVMTGGGGFHLYLSKPADLRIAAKLKGYPGIDFKTAGGQVVAAGSIHPETEDNYAWDPLEDNDLSLRPVAPITLLDALALGSARTAFAESGVIDSDQLATLLEALSAEQFSDHDTWLKLMMACHHATSGEGVDEFVAWSVTDARYAGHDETVRGRWASLSASRDHAVTYLTLFKAVSEAGRSDLLEAVMRSEASDDFADDLPPEPPVAPNPEAAALAAVNANHFTVLTSGAYLVGKERVDPLSGHTVVEWYHDHSIRKHLDAHSVEVSAGKRKPLGTWWVSHPERRRYEGVLFDPTPHTHHPSLYNLWRGWAVEPITGDWSLMKRLLRDVLCAGDEQSYAYALRWAAFMVQQPHVPAEVAMVFRGAKGVGKGTFGRALTALAGAHGRQIAQAEQFTGKFNDHLSETIMLFVDEGLWAGDKKLEGALKNLITEPTLTFEGKFKPVVTGPNRLHIVIASNETWVVPATSDERRFAVFEADSAAHRSLPQSFFEDLQRQMKQGGLAAMLAELQALDLTGWHPRSAIPTTRALLDQKVQGFRSEPLAFWWFRTLEDGHLGLALEEEAWANASVDVGSLAKDDMLSDLHATASGMGKRSEFTKSAMARFLGSVGVDVRARDRRGGKVWRVPPLIDARKAFEDWVGGPVSWD